MSRLRKNTCSGYVGRGDGEIVSPILYILLVKEDLSWLPRREMTWNFVAVSVAIVTRESIVWSSSSRQSFS